MPQGLGALLRCPGAAWPLHASSTGHSSGGCATRGPGHPALRPPTQPCQLPASLPQPCRNPAPLPLHPQVVKFKFENVGKLPPPVLQFTEVTFGYSPDKVLYRNVDLGADLDSRVAIVRGGGWGGGGGGGGGAWISGLGPRPVWGPLG